MCFGNIHQANREKSELFPMPGNKIVVGFQAQAVHLLGPFLLNIFCLGELCFARKSTTILDQTINNSLRTDA